MIKQASHVGWSSTCILRLAATCLERPMCCREAGMPLLVVNVAACCFFVHGVHPWASMREERHCGDRCPHLPMGKRRCGHSGQ